MNTTRLPSCLCPWCRKTLDATTDPVADATPSPGDASLCLRCGEWCVFEEDLTLRKPTTAEFVDIGSDDRCRNLRRAWEQTRIKF